MRTSFGRHAGRLLKQVKIILAKAGTPTVATTRIQNFYVSKSVQAGFDM